MFALLFFQTTATIIPSAMWGERGCSHPTHTAYIMKKQKGRNDDNGFTSQYSRFDSIQEGTKNTPSRQRERETCLLHNLVCQRTTQDKIQKNGGWNGLKREALPNWGRPNFVDRIDGGTFGNFPDRAQPYFYYYIGTLTAVCYWHWVLPSRLGHFGPYLLLGYCL